MLQLKPRGFTSETTMTMQRYIIRYNNLFYLLALQKCHYCKVVIIYGIFENTAEIAAQKDKCV